MLLEGKTVVVTGSSKGLGRAYAIALAKEGASVVVNGTVADDVAHVVEEIKSAGGNATGCIESVATMAGAECIIQTALDEFGHLDVLVNNAGVLSDRTLLKMTEEDWDTVITVHLKGTFACSKFAALVMSQQQSGSIINITSRAGFRGAMGECNYATAKAGVLGFTYTLAQELARYNIMVNSVWPRAITRVVTDFVLDQFLKRASEEALKVNAPPPSVLDLGFGEPEMVAPIIVFLASDEAKGITNKIFALTGEKLAVWAPPQELESAKMPGGWSVEKIIKDFKSTLVQPYNNKG